MNQSDILDYYNTNLRGRGNGGWALVAQVLGMSPSSTGAAYEIAHGKRAITKRQIMRWQWWTDYQKELPELVEVLPCPVCGEVHLYHCDAHKIVPIKPPAPSKARRPRVSTDFDPDVYGVFQTIRDMLEMSNDQFLQALLEKWELAP